MTAYQYTATDANGNQVAGLYPDVDSVAALRQELAKMGETLLKAKPAKSTTAGRTKIKPADIVAFTYKLAGMCSAGLSIVRALDSLEAQTDNQALRDVLADVRENVETGSTLKNAFAKHRNLFSEFFLGMVEAGESGGKLSTTLEMSAVYLEKQLELKRKIKSAFAYPVVVGLMCLLVVSGLVVFVIPVFEKLYQKLNVTLPLPTQLLIVLSTVVREWLWLILLIVAAVVILVKKYSRDHRLRARWDTFKLKIPVFGQLNRMVVVSRFIRTFAMLVSAGVTLTDALQVASRVADNSRMTKISEELQQSIETGNQVAATFRQYEIFPPMIVQLASAGEEAGALAEMLNKGVDFLEKDIERSINALLVKLEPVTTLIMGIVVGFILLGVYLPMFDYMSHFGK